MDSIGMILRTLAEIGVVAALIVGFLKENKFIRAERKAWRFLRALRRKAHQEREKELERELLDAQYAGEYETERRSRISARPVRAVKAAKKTSGSKKRKSARGRVA